MENSKEFLKDLLFGLVTGLKNGFLIHIFLLCLASLLSLLPPWVLVLQSMM